MAIRRLTHGLTYCSDSHEPADIKGPEFIRRLLSGDFLIRSSGYFFPFSTLLLSIQLNLLPFSFRYHVQKGADKEAAMTALKTVVYDR